MPSLPRRLAPDGTRRLVTMSAFVAWRSWRMRRWTQDSRWTLQRPRRSSASPSCRGLGAAALVFQTSLSLEIGIHRIDTVVEVRPIMGISWAIPRASVHRLTRDAVWSPWRPSRGLPSAWACSPGGRERARRPGRSTWCARGGQLLPQQPARPSAWRMSWGPGARWPRRCETTLLFARGPEFNAVVSGRGRTRHDSLYARLQRTDAVRAAVGVGPPGASAASKAQPKSTWPLNE